MVALTQSDVSQNAERLGNAPPVSQAHHQNPGLLGQGARGGVVSPAQGHPPQDAHRIGQALSVPHFPEHRHALFEHGMRCRVVALVRGRSARKEE